MKLAGIIFVIVFCSFVCRWVSVSTRREMENEDSIYW
jgi:hypothetical protein